MHSGMLIDDLFAVVERTQKFGHPSPPAGADPRRSRVMVLGKTGDGGADSFPPQKLESEKFAQPFGLSTADWNLCLLLVIHAQLVRALEPRNDFADAVDIHQVGTVRAPKKICV